MKKLTIALIGLGYWGPHILRNLATFPNISILGIDSDQSKLSRFSKNYPAITFLNDSSAAFNNKDVTGVIIATPPRTHSSLTKQSLISEKDTFVEKPMTTSLSDARDLVALAKKKKKILMVGHTFVYSEPIAYMKKSIEKNVFGKLFYYDSIRVNLGLLQKDGDVSWDLAVHDLSILDYLLEEKPKSILAVGGNYISSKANEDAHLFLSFASGFRAHIHVSWLSPVKIRKATLVGAKKMLTYDDVETNEKIRIYDKSVKLNKKNITPFSPAYRIGDIHIPHLSQKEPLQTEIKEFIDCIITRRKPLTDGESGVRVVRLLQEADRSLSLGKRIIFS